jgi:hypothetical protein
MGALHVELTQGTIEAIKVVVAVKAPSCRRLIFVPPEFIAGTAMCTELPRRCLACKNCKSFSSRWTAFRFKENAKYEK